MVLFTSLFILTLVVSFAAYFLANPRYAVTFYMMDERGTMKQRVEKRFHTIDKAAQYVADNGMRKKDHAVAILNTREKEGIEEMDGKPINRQCVYYEFEDGVKGMSFANQTEIDAVSNYLGFKPRMV